MAETDLNSENSDQVFDKSTTKLFTPDTIATLSVNQIYTIVATVITVFLTVIGATWYIARTFQEIVSTVETTKSSLEETEKKIHKLSSKMDDYKIFKTKIELLEKDNALIKGTFIK